MAGYVLLVKLKQQSFSLNFPTVPFLPSILPHFRDL
jgi:hypothetical protein